MGRLPAAPPWQRPAQPLPSPSHTCEASRSTAGPTAALVGGASVPLWTRAWHVPRRPSSLGRTPLRSISSLSPLC
eukprot:scaffold22420_cov124-Isochrysis_galbana.AAC.7